MCRYTDPSCTAPAARAVSTEPMTSPLSASITATESGDEERSAIRPAG